MKERNVKLRGMLALTAALCGTPVLAANVTLSVHGTEFTTSGTPREFQGTIQYDTGNLLFDPWNNGGFSTSDFSPQPVQGTLQFKLGAQSYSANLTRISIWKNVQSHSLYENFAGFYAGGYSFEMKFSRETPVAWNREPVETAGGLFGPGFTGLLPTSADSAFWHQPDVFAAFFTPSSWIIVDSYTFSGTSEVPVPAAAWLFGSGLAGLAAARTRRRAVT